jgi:hypothetical protein
MKSWLGPVEQILRGPARGVPAGQSVSLFRLTCCTLVFGAVYGGTMGSFGGIDGERSWQVVISAAKVPMLLMVSFGLSLPSFFVLNSLLGVRSDFHAVLRALMSSQAGLTVVLAALAPYTLFWYASSASYQWALLFNALMFAIASLAGQLLLWAWYRPLLARATQHRWLLRIWLIIYAFVGVQMAWILRPFIGDPGMPIQFIRQDTWGNAYIIVGRTIWETLAQALPGWRAGP